jgi:hypothetical protein
MLTQAGKPDAAKRAYFRAISACAWSKVPMLTEPAN